MSIVERALAKAQARGKPGERERPDVSAVAAVAPGANLLASAQGGRFVALELERLRAAGLFPSAEMEQVIAEEFRLIRRPLLLNAARRDPPTPNGNLIMVGSALPGAGKTFTSLNLALSMASELDWTVMLVDGDLTRPTVSRCLGLEQAPGLVNLLEDPRGTLADYVYGTDHARLRFLPAGPSRPDARELVASQRMQRLVADLANHEQTIVVFDSPPLLLTSEARVLAGYAGQIVLVVEAGATPRRSLSEAIEILDQNKPINLILNKNRQLLGVGDYQYPGYGAYVKQSQE